MRHLLIIHSIWQKLSAAVVLAALFLPTTAKAETGAHLVGALARATYSIINGRPAKPGEYPGVVSLTYFNGSNPLASHFLSGCTGSLLGQCVLTAAHCADDLPQKVVATCESGESAEVDKNQIKTFGYNAERKAGGTDIALLRLKTKLPNAYSADDLADSEVPGTPVKLDEFTEEALVAAKEFAPRVEFVGFGQEVPPVEIKEDLDAMKPSERAAAKLGAKFGERVRVAKPRKQVGTGRLFGRLADVTLHKEIGALESGLKDARSMTGLQKWWYAKDIATAETRAKNALDELTDHLGAYIFIKDPSRGSHGDSGGPVLAQIDGKKKIIGVVSGGMDEKHLKPTDDNRFNLILDMGGAVFTPITRHRNAILKAAKQMGCFDQVSSRDSFEQMRKNRP